MPNAAAGPVQPSPESKQLRVRTAEEIANAQTAEQLGLRIWAALVGEKQLSIMSGLVDELLDAHLLDDDDEETDESWLDDHRKHEDKLLSEAIADGLEKYPDINAITSLQHPSADMAQAAEQLRELLAKCAIGATRFAEKFSRAELECMVKRDVKARFENDPNYSQHMRAEVPGSDIRKYGERGRLQRHVRQSGRLRRRWRLGRAVDWWLGAGLQGSHRRDCVVLQV